MITRRDLYWLPHSGQWEPRLPSRRRRPIHPAPKQQQRAARLPIIVSAGNGYPYLDRAYQQLNGGADTLESVIAVVKGPEDDPTDDSVGLGGLPNEEGVVELDASCMHGPTRRAGAVGGGA